MKKTLTFETKCYQDDYQIILNEDYLKKMIDRCQYKFDKKVVILNNIYDLGSAERQANSLIRSGIIDEFHIVEDYNKAALRFLNIKKESFGNGYYYSIAELVGICLCDTDYLLHFSSDSIMGLNTGEWIPEAIKQMERLPFVAVANPVWNFKFEEARSECFIDNNEDWFLGQGFSDQCYLIKTETFKRPIYNEKNVLSERYPKYGGELFEKRVDAWMRNNNLCRITSKHCSYIHENIPKTFEEQLKWKNSR